MSKWSRKETTAIVAVIVVFVVGLAWTLLKSVKAATEPGLTLHEAFAQPPGAPPPGRPAGIDANTHSTPQPAAGNEAVSNGAASDAASNGTAAADAMPAASSSSGAPTSSASSPAFAANFSGASAGSAVSPTGAGNSEPAAASPPTHAGDIVVHVAGAVHKPGVYHLPSGARNDDAIKQAGGATPNASTEAINLAARVEDGSQLFIPTRKQHPEGGADVPATTAAGAIPFHAASSNAKPAAKPTGRAPTKAAKGEKGGKSGKLSDPSQGTVNINTAGADELQRIPGIGPAMAERILDFRKQSGKFQAPEDLLQISGIGEKKFARMQPFIRVR